ncbi:syndecan-1-like isoform X2 [Brienomyrus brachyistius]|uniref:syndecan-1-like isoform X2 n=1 Tax=Brienomyrus brachyistius TaxID=42636 RepID=UPI0020B3A99E|nr:syndecan-1-like isoform X2 [Brienomyrus brachyistius]
MRLLLALLLAAVWVPGTLSDWSPPDDQDASGDDLETSGSGSGDDDLMGFSLTLPSTPSSVTTRVSTTTERNRVPMRDPVRAVTSQASPTTAAGGVVTSHWTAGPPAEGGVVTEDRLHGQTTSASPDAHEEHSTSLPTKAQPRAGMGIHNQTAATPSHSTTISTTTVVMHVNTTAVIERLPVVPESEHTSTKKTQPAPTPVAPAQDKIPSVTRHVPTSGSPATTPTLLPTVPEEPIIKGGRSHVVGSEPEKDTDIVIDEDLTQQQFQETGQSQSLLDRKEVLAGVISGGVVGLAFAVLLVSLMVYRMKKKDEGSYSLDEHSHPNVGYQRPQGQEEFLA